MEQERELCSSFERTFLAAKPLSSFRWADLKQNLENSSDTRLLLDILKMTVLHPLCREHPPSVKYRRLFLSELIKKHESTASEPLDELYETFAAVLRMEDSTLCHKSYLLPSGNSVTLLESMAMISQGTTGLITWEAALYLAEWAIGNSHLFTDRTVLELGSGIGLTGLAICKTSKPKKYIFSDCHPHVLQQLRKNIQLNGFLLETEEQATRRAEHPPMAGTALAVLDLDWDSVSAEQLKETAADIVIAADVVYDPQIILSLVCVLQRISNVRRNGRAAEVFVASTVRNPETYHQFQTELNKAGIAWEVIPGHTKTLFPYDLDSSIEILNLFTKHD
ncbi:protein-lysine N-methyltransferase EEF2KMT [Rhinatrema bivittatum]|uniref:protein-lysine N-methyltransferase EEF2KMT n=1 Tax=Rhinatrema bivittatum TaxID=194408 RepID=UPI00112BA108|nr:protein-lysine N-methyltransferase EEF2KMT [Rhinatrema bivittatum]